MIRKKREHERYGLQQSPLAQKPTQKELAELLGETKGDLLLLLRYKEQFIVRRTTTRRGKTRNLAYPEKRLRAAHERLKYHLSKIKQRSYLFSPRSGRGQRDNANQHLSQQQYLSLDLKQFYPSTTASMVRRWCSDDLGMYEDVACLFTKLCTIDEKVPFGSPVTPVLCSLIHRRMFDLIADLCGSHGLNYTVWVDDLTISGDRVPGAIVDGIRNIVRMAGLASHKIRYRSGNKPVFITGIGVLDSRLIAPNSLNLRIKGYLEDFHAAETTHEKEFCIQKLLSQLGTKRYIVGATSEEGRRTADLMNSLRQKRDKLRRTYLASQARPTSPPTGRSGPETNVEIPF